LKRKFITNLGFLLVLNIIVKPLYVFGIDRVVQNRVGAEIYGSYIWLFNLALIFQILLDLGIENFVRKEISQFPHLVSSYLSNIFLLKGFMGAVYFILCFIVAIIMGIKLSAIPLLVIILLNQFMASFILYLRANLGGLQLFRTESIISVLDRSIMILCVGTLLLFPGKHTEFKIKWFVLSQTLAYGITLGINFYLVYRKAEFFRPEFNLSEILPIINRLRPYALLILLMNIYFRVDSILLVKLLPDGEIQAGIYAHGFRILDFLTNYAFLFPMLLLPIFSRIIYQKEKIDELLKLSTLILLVPSFAIIIPSLFYRYELFGLLYNEQITKSADAFVFLSISYFGMCISYIFGALLTANGNLRQLNIMAGIAVGISLILNLILIPHYKVIGAAISNASAQTFTIIFHIILAIKVFKLRVKVVTVLKIIGFVASIILFGYCLKYFAAFWLIKFTLIFSFGMIFAFVSGLISINGIIKIIRQE
jgi:O-antigen/teichoic acid export membrane protein